MNSEDSFDGLYNSRILKAVDVTANCKGIRNANGGLPSIKPPSVLVRAFSVDEPKPGAPSCSPADSKKYFGGGARDDFFKRNKWLGRQLKITEVRKSGSPTPHLYFDSTDADENYETPVKRHSSISSYKKDTYVSSLFNGESSDGNSVCVNNANNFTPTNSIIKYSGLVKSPVLNAESAFLTNLDQTPGSNQISGDYDSVLTEESQQSLWLEPVDGNMPLSRIEQENTNFDDSGELFDISVCRGADRGKALAAILGRRDHNISTPNPEKDLLAQGSSAQVLDCLAIPHSPRTAYLVGCASEQVLPRPSLLLRKELTTELNLKHQGMGNTRAGIIADSIRALPGIETLNLQDNNLTCHGLCAMFEAIRTASSFTSLDIADNKLGKASSAALADYLASRSCHLKKLGLRNADVSDEECERFVSVIQENPNLLELDMSHNDLGGAEGLNSVLPDIVTAGEALGTLLMDRNCSLQVLNVSWNKIRLGGAEALVRSIGMNKSLLHLDMSYNSLSTKGGILLGAALADNHSLRLLNISNNSIDEIACFTICQSIILNDSLEEVYMDGNPIGEQGAKSLMLVALSIRQPLTAFSAKNCNASIKDPRCSFITPITAGASGKPQYFDCEYPMGSYELYLDYPFHRAIALALLDIASRHVGFVIKNATYEPAGACWEKSGGQAATKIGAVEHLEFITMFSTERSKHLSPSESDVLQYFEMCLKLLQDREAVMHHFYDMADTREGSDVAYASDSESSDEGVENREYELGRLEFFSLMHKIGFNRMTMSEVDDILLLYDLDGSNSIGLEEFLEYVENEEEILEFKIKNLVRQPITVFAGDNGKNNDGNCLKYVPPSTGILRFEVRDGLMKKPVYKVLSVWDSTEVVSMARKTDSTTMAMLFAAKFSKLRLDEAVQLFNAAYKEKQMSRAAILTHLLPSVEDPAEARRLLYIGTEGDRMELQQVRKRLGYLLNVILAQYDGYYHLDLRNENDRTCLSRFIALSDEINERRKAMCPLKSGLVGDYSQHGNWTCFRNETVNSNPVEITSHTFQPCPVRGIVEFDFISGERPKKKYLPMSDKRFFGVLQSACLMNEMHVEQAREHISDLKKQNEMSSYGDGRCVANSVDEERGTAIFKAMEMFHDNISKRHEGFARAVSDVLGSGTGAGSSTRPSTTAGGGRRRLPSTAGGGAVTPRRNPGSESAPAPDSSGKQVPEENTKNAVPILPNIDLATGQSPAVLRTDRPKSSGRPKSSARPRTGGKKRLRNISRVYHIDENVPSEYVISEEDLKDVPPVPKRDGTNSRLSSPAPAATRWTRAESMARIENEPVDDDLVFQRKVAKRQRQRLYFVKLLADPNAQPHSKAIQVVEKLNAALCTRYFTCSQMVILFECFPQGKLWKYTNSTEGYNFSNFRIDLLISVLSHITDLQNLNIVMAVMTPKELGCFICRVGWFNGVFNPLKPDRGFRMFNVGMCQESRQLLKIYFTLSVKEAGENIIDEGFRWITGADDDWIPGWELPATWANEASVQNKGVIKFRYCSGINGGPHTVDDGFVPDVDLRRALCQMTVLRDPYVRYPVAEKEKRAAEGIVDSNPSPAPTAVQEVPAAPEVLVIDNDDGVAVSPDAAVGERRKKKTKALKAIRTDITADDYIRKHEDTFIYLCKHPPCTYGLSLIAANQLAENTAADVEVTDTGVNDKKGQKGKKGKK